MSTAWEHRWHPVRGEWVQIAAQSAARPWAGATVGADERDQPLEHDPSCYLCPGVQRAHGDVNPHYTAPYAFDNDFANLVADPPGEAVGRVEQDPLHCTRPPLGRCRVLCWTPRHDLTLADFDDAAMRPVVDLWAAEFTALASDPSIAQVSIFENKGVEVGVSNLHPHGQVYATGFVSEIGQRERETQARYQRDTGNPLLQSLLNRPEYQTDLLVECNTHWVAIVPFFARYPFEVWIVPRRALCHIGETDDSERSALGALYCAVLRRFDALFQRRTPHNTLLHNAPCDDHPDNAAFGFHLVVQCPLRAPGMLKYLGGYEQLAGNIVNPVLPESAAKALRDAEETP